MFICLLPLRLPVLFFCFLSAVFTVCCYFFCLLLFLLFVDIFAFYCFLAVCCYLVNPFSFSHAATSEESDDPPE